MGTFKAYRSAGELETRIKMAVAMFYKSWGVLPAAIVVNKCELDGARVAAERLELGVPIGSIGGCLVPEVWLEIGNTTGGKM